MAFEFAYRLGGGVPVVKEFPGKASEVIAKGYPVNLESGLLCAGAAADTAFVGIANESITPAADGEMIEVVVATAQTVFRVDYVGSSLPDPTNANLGTAFDLKSTALNKIDLDDTTGGAWILIDFDTANDKAYVVLDRDKASVLAGGSPDATE